MRKLATGEPYAGKPHVRFGGRGGQKPSLPLSAAYAAKMIATNPPYALQKYDFEAKGDWDIVAKDYGGIATVTAVIPAKAGTQ